MFAEPYEHPYSIFLLDSGHKGCFFDMSNMGCVQIVQLGRLIY